MVKDFRKQFNSEFTPERYEAFVDEMNTTYRFPVDFRLAETPIFLSREFSGELFKACDEILSLIQSDGFKQHSSTAIPKGLSVPNETAHTTFLQIDFALAASEDGTLHPRLIELQGFPSLYCFQVFQDETVRRHFSIPEHLTAYFSNFNRTSYLQLLREVIIDGADPETTILLEIEPEKQKTRIDFACTEKMLGIPMVSVTDVIKRGKKLLYRRGGKEIPITRIYNRVIFDELLQKNLNLQFQFTDEIDVTWVGHPNWFFKISKHSLPYLKSQYVPPAFFLSELSDYPSDVQNYVLKPLYSFAGSGVEVNVTKAMLDQIKQKENYILQKKITYAPSIETPDLPSKAEIRMMFIWQDKPVLVNNLVRLSKGAMMGVNFNKNKTWVGSSLAYHF